MEEVVIEYHTASGKSSAQKLMEVPSHLEHSLEKVTSEAGGYIVEGVQAVGSGIVDVAEWSAEQTGNIVGSFFSGLGLMNTILILILSLVTVVIGLKFLL